MKQNAGFLIVLSLFIGHQILEKGLGIHFLILDSYLDPMLGMALLLVAWKWEQKILFQKHIKSEEIIMLCLLTSVFFEWILPIYHSGFTRDPVDLIFYGIGGLIFSRFLNPAYPDMEFIASE